MKEANGAQVASDEHPGTPKVAPRFTRAVKAERSRLEDKRSQLLQKREAAQAELGCIDRAVEATDELLALLVPLLAGDGGDPDAADQNGTTKPGPGPAASEAGERPARDRARDRASAMRARSGGQAQPAKE